jgi:protein-S-isoprenylcysteine O-methyltransferase Ste14
MNTQKKNMILNRIAPFLAVLMLPLCLFPFAGHWEWWQGWVFIAVNVLMSAISRGLVAIKNPSLIKERASFTASEGIKTWDKKLVPLVVYLPLLVMIVAALNLRYAWQPQVPFWLQMLGLVRIQTDRGHIVVSDGPYRGIRHPGYASAILANLSFPFLLGSYWAQVPMVFVLVVIIIRTLLEDSTLQAELPGYRDYATRVRYRLLPGIW